MPALVVFSVIPFGADTTLFGLLPQPIPPYLTDINIGILFVLGVSSVGIYGIILGGWASNNKFSLMGGLRSAAQLISYEVPMGFSVVAVLLMAEHACRWSRSSRRRRQAGVWFVFPGIVAFFIYFVCGVAETNRNPFDLPEAESELVAGFHTEYSGMKWAFFFLGRVRQHGGDLLDRHGAVLRRLAAAVPERRGAGVPRRDPAVHLVRRQGRLSFLFVYIWFRGTFPRYRFDQLMALGWKVLLPVSLVNLHGGRAWACCCWEARDEPLGSLASVLPVDLAAGALR